MLAACSAPPPARLAERDIEVDRHPLLGYRAGFALTWQGARMGGAVEELAAAGDGLRFIRDERIVIRRGDLLVPYQTRIAIDTDRWLRAHRVVVDRRAGAVQTRGAAERDPDGRWRVRFGDAPARLLPGDAVPAELVPLLVAGSATRRFRGTVFLPGSGFALAELAVQPAAGDRHRPPRQVLARVLTDVGELRSTVLLTADGLVDRVVGADSVGARRVDVAELDQPFDPPELVDGASIPVAGALPAAGPVDLVVDVAWRPPPEPLPGQQVNGSGGRWQVRLLGGAPAAAGGRLAELSELARRSADLLEDDLGAPATEASAALALGRGDCTAHAVLFASMAAQRGFATRLVTGYRLDQGRLVRHRWAIAEVGGAWIAVDPTFGEAPAGPRLLGLAAHGASEDELSLVDAVAFAGMARARAAIVPFSR